MVAFGDLTIILDCTHGHRLMQSSRSFLWPILISCCLYFVVSLCLAHPCPRVEGGRVRPASAAAAIFLVARQREAKADLCASPGASHATQ